MSETLSKDLENEMGIGSYYYHENLSKPISDLHKILIYKIISISNCLATVEIYNRNGIIYNDLQETDFKFDGHNKIISLEDCLKDIRAKDNFKIKRFSYRTFSFIL